MKSFFIAIVLTISTSLIAQDTLTVMQYNLLNYGNFTSYCTESNNNLDSKDEYISTLIDYVKPDIFTVNEMSKSSIMHQRLLDNGLNTNGKDYYRMADFIKVADSYLVNMLYFNSNKLAFHSHTIAQSYIRDIDVYRLYYKSNDLILGDTAFVTMVVTHLKASSDETAKRFTMVKNAMEYLDNHPELNNMMFMGDFNVYTPTEPAYQELIDYSNPELSFNDPVNQDGEWHNNYDYRYYHSQSTHSSSNGCASTGGMDDRFDFILISNDIKDGAKNVQYINGSYTTLGQDGKHFNSSLISSPDNTSVPADILAALYGNSDHLPIIMKLEINKTLGVNEYLASSITEISFTNPVQSNVNFDIYAKESGQISINILSIAGNNIKSTTEFLNKGSNTINIDLKNISNGIYLAVFTDKNRNRFTKKIIVNR